jgi:arylsulfatase A-like enzyme
MITRRKFLQATGGFAATHGFAPALSAGRAPVGGDRPNILIFMSEQQQGQTVLPDHPCLTPNIDKFAAQGVLFPNAFCPTPHCCPSRASFQTGLYPSEHGIFNNVDTNTAFRTDPYPDTRFFSRSLVKAGYQLAFSGKWHVGRNVTPEDCGWKVLYTLPYDAEFRGKKIPGGLDGTSSKWPKARAEFDHPVPRQPGQVMRPGWGNPEFINTVPAGPDGYLPDDYEVVQPGIDGMKTLAAGGKPWCLMIAPGAAGHDPYRATQKFLEMYDPKSIELPASFRDTLEDKPRIYQRMRYQYWSQLSDDEVRQVIAHYWACLSMEDALFGLMLEALERTGQAENTLVVYTADHGDYMASHGLWCKGVPSFREGYNVPCVIRWPRGTVNPGRQVDALVSMTDFAPTFLEAAGVPAADYKMSGKSLLPWLRGEAPADWRDAAFGQVNGMEAYYTQRVVMTKDYKYVYNDYDYDEMYYLRNDPHEMVNLAFPNVELARARIEHAKGLENPADVPWPPLPSALSEARLDLLQKMWRFANDHKDTIFESYYTCAMAPYGPMAALRIPKS